MAVPFFPQREWQCGPAALATVLVHSGVDTTPEALAPRVYVPGRQGSFQQELLAATRRAGRIPYVLAPKWRALIGELAAQRPVVVLQNLGFAAWPRWHYAVVVGYDAATEILVLRSGTERRRLISSEEFLRTWALGSQWALVVLQPGELPVADDADGFVRALASAESMLTPDARVAAYRAAAARWPAHRLSRLGYANALGGRGDVEQAVAQWEVLAEADPHDAVVLNNLADALGRSGCRARALATVEQASRFAPGEGRIRATIEATRREIEASPVRDHAACGPAPAEERP